MQREPPPFVWAAPEEKDILTCAPIHSYVTHFIAHSSLRQGILLSYERSKLETHREADTLILLSQHGPPDSPYVAGEYHGVLLFPSEYPFKPPGIKVSRVASALGSTPTPCVFRCTRRLVVSNQTRKSVFPCLISILALCVDFPSLPTCASFMMWIVSISIYSGTLRGALPQCKIYRSRGTPLQLLS